MFLFSCCQTAHSNSGYQVRKKDKNNEDIVTFVNTLKDVHANDLNNIDAQILKLEKSQYDDLIKEYKGTEKKWIDPSFPPEESSLGQIPNVTSSQWKRLSDLLHKPALFDGKVLPKDVIQGSLGDCYLLSALATLAQKQQRIKKVFGNQTYNPNGIYKVTLRIDGTIQEILVDDFVPVNTRGEPLFCQPNKNQFWVLILQKAWAKAHGSYANIIAGSPSEVFKAVTYAPAQMHSIKQNQEERQKTWRLILDHAKKNHPCCCSTDDRQDIDWEKIDLLPGHAYTLVNAAELQHSNGRIEQMLLLRNPWNKIQWEGEGSQHDDEFWSKIIPSQQKNLFLSYRNKSSDGIFFMKYSDFCKYFSQVHFSMMQDNGNYLAQTLYTNKKNGSIFTFEVKQPGQYTFQLHQSGIKKQDQESAEDGLCRSTLLVGRVKDNNNCEFIDGVLRYNDEDTTLKTQLERGKYILFAKLDPTRIKGLMPKQSSVSVYSVQFTQLVPSEKKAHPDLLKKMFLSYARLNKRQTYQNDLMWIAWKLLFQQGGYAYIAFGNSPQSNKKFVITFDQSQFDNLNFKLKKPFKRKGNGQILQILPGQQIIILARVKNISVKGLKFPPQIGIKLERVGQNPKKSTS